MPRRNALSVAIALTFTSLASGQESNPPKPAAPAAAAAVDVDTALRTAFKTGDSTSMVAALKALAGAGTEGRVRLRTMRERLQPVADAVAKLPRETTPDPKAAATPLDDATMERVVDLLGGDAAKAEAAAKALAELTSTSPVQARCVVARGDGLFANHLLGFLREQSMTGAIYAGQYTTLRELGPPALDLLITWSTRPPSAGGSNPAEIRQQCVRAFRDIVEGTPPENVAKCLEKLASAQYENADVQIEARCALAQFGNRSFVDPQIEKLSAQLEAENTPAKGQALSQLAEIHYRLRDYAAAVDVYRKHIELIEAGKLGKANLQMATLYYNTCCSMALGGKIDDAFAMLDKAIDEGRKSGSLPRALLQVDRDIDALRQDPRFAQAMAKFDGKTLTPRK